MCNNSSNNSIISSNSSLSIESIDVQTFNNEDEKVDFLKNEVNNITPLIEQHQQFKIDLLNARNSGDSNNIRFIKANKTLCKLRLGDKLNNLILFLLENYDDFESSPNDDDDELYNLCCQCRYLYVINDYIKNKYNIKDIDYLIS